MSAITLRDAAGIKPAMISLFGTGLRVRAHRFEPLDR